MFYKVVFNYNGILLSAFANRFNTRYLELEYKLNEWTEPKHKNSKIFAFSSYDTAEYFVANLKKSMSINKYLEIYRCEVINPSHFGPYIKRIVIDEKLALEYFKSNNIVGKQCDIYNTVFCDKIKLVEKIT